MRWLWRWAVCDSCKGTGDCCLGACGRLDCGSAFTCWICDSYGGAWVPRWPWVERVFVPPPLGAQVGPEWRRRQQQRSAR